MRNIVGAIGFTWQVAPCKLVFALSARFNPIKPALNRELDRLVVADFEMQKRSVLDTAPVPTKQAFTPNKVDRASNVSIPRTTHHQQDSVGHRLTHAREKRSRQIGRPPLSVAGIHIEAKEMIPVCLSDHVPGESLDHEITLKRIPSFAPNVLAFFTRQIGQEGIKAVVALVLPVILLMRA